jgi:hypothetical protein
MMAPEVTMSQHEDRIEGIETNADDASPDAATIFQGGARSVRAREVEIKQGGAMRVDAEEVEITQGGIGFARTGSAEITAGGVGVVIASGEVELEASAAQIVVGRDEVTLEQSATAVLAAGSVDISHSVVGVLLARHVDARNVRVLFDVPAAIAFGAAAGAMLWVFGRRRR